MENVLKFLGLGFTIVLIGLFLKHAGDINTLFGTYNQTLSVLEKAA